MCLMKTVGSEFFGTHCIECIFWDSFFSQRSLNWWLQGALTVLMVVTHLGLCVQFLPEIYPLERIGYC